MDADRYEGDPRRQVLDDDRTVLTNPTSAECAEHLRSERSIEFRSGSAWHECLCTLSNFVHDPPGAVWRQHRLILTEPAVGDTAVDPERPSDAQLADLPEFHEVLRLAAEDAADYAAIGRAAIKFAQAARVVPPEPPQPTTERVQWWEALRDGRLLVGLWGAVLLDSESAVAMRSDDRIVLAPPQRSAECWRVGVGADGTVEVLAAATQGATEGQAS